MPPSYLLPLPSPLQLGPTSSGGPCPSSIRPFQPLILSPSFAFHLLRCRPGIAHRNAPQSPLWTRACRWISLGLQIVQPGAQRVLESRPGSIGSFNLQNKRSLPPFLTFPSAIPTTSHPSKPPAAWGLKLSACFHPSDIGPYCSCLSPSFLLLCILWPG